VWGILTPLTENGVAQRKNRRGQTAAELPSGKTLAATGSSRPADRVSIDTHTHLLEVTIVIDLPTAKRMTHSVNARLKRLTAPTPTQRGAQFFRTFAVEKRLFVRGQLHAIGSFAHRALIRRAPLKIFQKYR